MDAVFLQKQEMPYSHAAYDSKDLEQPDRMRYLGLPMRLPYSVEEL
jgi:hypothetical protein